MSVIGHQHLSVDIMQHTDTLYESKEKGQINSSYIELGDVEKLISQHVCQPKCISKNIY